MSGDVSVVTQTGTPTVKGGKARRARRAEIRQHLDRRPRFYYLRDKTGLPFITVCDIIYNNTVYRGVSIFSPRVTADGKISTISPRTNKNGEVSHKKRTVLKKSAGRKISFDRAVAAAIVGIPQLPIHREEALNTIKLIKEVPNQPLDVETLLEFKTGMLGAPPPRKVAIAATTVE